MKVEISTGLVSALLIILSMSGCADGSALIIGETRPAVEDWSSVLLLTEMPEAAEEIAIVEASSDSGMSQEQRLDYAVETLKKQAAKVGANAVVLVSRSTEIQRRRVPILSSQRGTMVELSEMEIVEGVAVYVGN